MMRNGALSNEILPNCEYGTGKRDIIQFLRALEQAS